MLSIKKLKQKAIEKFKKKYGLKKYDIISIKGQPLGRIDYFFYDEEQDKPYASLKFEDEVGCWILDGRKSSVYPEDFENGTVKKLKEEEVDHCVHYFTDGEPTGRYKTVLTLAGLDKKEIYQYTCKFCGKIAYNP